MTLIPAAALPRLRCGRVPAAPLTADAGAAPWQHIEPVHLQDNLGGGSPNQASRVRTAWDDAAWRVLFDVDDAHPWATLTQRGGPLWTEEVVEVFIDPIGDLEGYFEVEINPLGTVVDLVLRHTRSGWCKDFTWQVDGLESLVRRTATGWAAELRVPFEALAAPLPMAGAFREIGVHSSKSAGRRQKAAGSRIKARPGPLTFLQI